jgi:hypothetical protein
MAKSAQTVSQDELSALHSQCTALHEDWQRFYQLAAAPPPSDPSQHHLAFIQLQSRLSCDYPILSRWRKSDLGIASHIGKLVAEAGTLETFSDQLRAGGGPLVQEWQSVNDAIGRVQTALSEALQRARNGKPARLPKEIAPPVAREPWNFAPAIKAARMGAVVLIGGGILFVLLQPLFVESSLLNWLDDAYTAWQIRNGVPGMTTTAP